MKSVLLGMSGGVDSSVAAKILLEQGYNVVGVNMKLWHGEAHNQKKTCCSFDDIEDARAVANKLNIPFYVINMQKMFAEKVIDHFIHSYCVGETPNPCIECNRHLKFSAMLKKADELAIDYISTGHYARVEFDQNYNCYRLLKAYDEQKDQSYVLYMLKQVQLKRLLLPLGNMNKSDIRLMANNNELCVANKPDSQDICFVSDNDYAGFIRRNSVREIECGDIVDAEGRVLGRHSGLIDYTVGQRKGLGVASGRRLYVQRKDVKNNQLVVSEKPTNCRKIIVRDVTFTSDGFAINGQKLEVKTRYSSSGVLANIYPCEFNKCIVEVLERETIAAPGQAAVFYDEQEVIGGGIITEIID